MLKAIRDWLDAREGKELATQAIYNIRSGSRSAVEERTLFDRTCAARSFGRYSAFVRAYGEVWQIEGDRDAYKGFSRSQEYANRSYDLGWCTRYEELSQNGWTHRELDLEHKRIIGA